MAPHEKDSFAHSAGPFDRLREGHLEGKISSDKLEKLTARFRAEHLDEKQLAVLFGILAGRLGHDLLASILRSAATFVLAAEEGEEQDDSGDEAASS